MAEDSQSMDQLIDSLQERAKELNCLYAVEEALQNTNYRLDDVLKRIVDIIPSGMQYPEICRVKVVYQDFSFVSEGFKETSWSISEDITVQDRVVGWIKIFYLEEKPTIDEGPFLLEERRVLNSIAKRLGHYIMYQKLKLVFDGMDSAKQVISEGKSGEWQAVLDLLRRTDPDIFTRISRKMLNYLVWRGIQEAEQLLAEFVPLLRYGQQDLLGEGNSPLQKRAFDDSDLLRRKVFDLAKNHLSDKEILSLIQDWVKQDKTSFLVQTTSSINSSLTDIKDAIRRYFKIAPDGLELAPSARIGVRASLIRRFFSDQLEFVTLAKSYVRVGDFNDLIQHLICPQGSHGKLGGKSAGLFLARRILNHYKDQQELFKDIQVPKTWYVSSDTMIQFMHYNGLEELLEQKYKSIEDIQKEYPNVVLLFKNSHFPPELVQGLSMALDDFDDKPLIVRSSSLLEDRLGSAFSGKYKSLFLANQGDKNQRLAAVLDALAEVYASTLGPDPMQYRSERGLIDFHEEMGIMIQEVVGQHVGDYFIPAFAGVAFSNNEFRWSPRIKREDGLIRLVPGLGTRAVDRLSDDYPILIAPGKPGLKANVSIEDRVRYSPQKIDVLNLKENRFETIEIKKLLREAGDEYPAAEKVLSIFEHDHLRKPFGLNIDFKDEDMIVTFDGLINDSTFVKRIHAILKTLQNTLATPVDIEFASNGDDFYLLQCRPQSYTKYDAPSPIPKDIPKKRIIFTANRFVSNGTVPDITYIVYVDPENYNKISSLDELKAVGRAIGKLNQVLPKRHFILMGPGRWGSRGDIKLGVNVTYSDINNTAVLLEVARKKGNYVPDLSFGTHFFQDLVEASIRYLPLYPDEQDTIFNEEFLNKTPSVLVDLVPDYAHLRDIIRVIDVPAVAHNMVLRILMNADLDQALAMLSPKGSSTVTKQDLNEQYAIAADDHWRWRISMADKIAQQLDAKRFGVKAMYVVGSTADTRAQEGSDIDILITFNGSQQQKKDLLTWLEGWSLCLDEMNFLRTGYKSGGLLDVHLVSEADLADTETMEAKLKIRVEGMKELALAGKLKEN